MLLSAVGRKLFVFHRVKIVREKRQFLSQTKALLSEDGWTDTSHLIQFSSFTTVCHASTIQESVERRKGNSFASKEALYN